MKVSVIVPVYNVEKYLRECIDSLLDQTMPVYEILLVNDGSKDNSGAICDEYATRFDNVRVIHKENAGLGMARNTGLDHITGDYVAFLDSDDYLSADWLEVLSGALQEHHVDVCKSGFQYVRDDRTLLSATRYADEVFPGDEARTCYAPRLVGSSPEKKDSLEMCVTATLYNVAIIKKHNIRFLSEREILSEDMPFNIDYMQYANGACTISYVGYHYRSNATSLTKSYRPDRFAAACHFFEHMQSKLSGYGYDSATLLRLCRIFFVYVRVCIAQECRAVSRHSAAVAVANIRQICWDERTVNTIASYPVGKLGIKQRAFVYMLRFKTAGLLYACANRGII